MTEFGAFGSSRLYAIADADAFGRLRLPDLVDVWVGAGVRCIQVRAKSISERELYDVAVQCKRRISDHGLPSVAFWINDSVSVARDVEATGVHLGQADLEPSAARRRLAEGQLIGRSTHDREQALTADRDPNVDVIAVGPIFATASKSDTEPEVGACQLRSICAAVAKPVVAIGGIDHKTCRAVLDAGAATVAVIGALRGDGTLDEVKSLAGSLVKLVEP